MAAFDAPCYVPEVQSVEYMRDLMYIDPPILADTLRWLTGAMPKTAMK